jgi:hypothetical protein
MRKYRIVYVSSEYMQHISYSEKESCWQPRQLGQVSGYDEDKATAPSSGLYYSIEFVSSLLPL